MIQPLLIIQRHQMYILSLLAQILLLGVISTICHCAVLKQSARVILEEDALQETTNPPIPYNFEYDSRDQNGTMLFRKESKDGSGKVEGRYGYKDMHGIERIVEYVADKDGYRAKIRTNEPGIDRTNSAGVEFYAAPSNQHVQIAKKQGENLAAVNYKAEDTAEERKNMVAEKVDAEITNQYSGGVMSHPSELRSQHHLFPRRHNDILRLNQNAPLNSVQVDQPKEVPATSSNENAILQPLHYAQQFPTTTIGRQQFEILNSQEPTTQYVSSKVQPQLIPTHRQLVTLPFNQLYIPQNQPTVAFQKGAVSSTTQVQTFTPQVIAPQHFYYPHPQQGGLITVPLSYAQAPVKGAEHSQPLSYAQEPAKSVEHTQTLSYAQEPAKSVEHTQTLSYVQAPAKGTEYIPLGRRISGLSEYFQ